MESLRTDNGGEYEKELIPVLQSLGVKHQTTAPYTSQSNGKAERLNRTLEEAVRAMLFHANMPEKFWADAMVTAAYVSNFLPSKAIDNEIPWEVWYQKPITKQILDKLLPFGSIVHIHTPWQRRWIKGKLATRSTLGCFIGYKVSQTGEPTNTYKVWDFERKCFDTSHNIIKTKKYPNYGDFDEPPIAPPLPQAARTLQTNDTAPEPSGSSEPKPPEPKLRPIFDSIEVQPPIALEVFAAVAKVLDADPTTYVEAMQRPDSEYWLKAMKDELASIEKNKTWILCDLPPGRKCIGTKWVYRIKRDGNNNFERYKCRVVAKGYVQIPGVDYDRTFAPVVRIESIRALIAIAVFNRWYILQVDCKTAFLNGNSDLEIYVSQPEGFVSKQYPHKVLRLRKSLYGLKQAPRIWYLLLLQVIIALGFIQLDCDPSIHVLRKGSYQIILAVYVDDILIFGSNLTECE